MTAVGLHSCAAAQAVGPVGFSRAESIQMVSSMLSGDLLPLGVLSSLVTGQLAVGYWGPPSFQNQPAAISSIKARLETLAKVEVAFQVVPRGPGRSAGP